MNILTSGYFNFVIFLATLLLGAAGFLGIEMIKKFRFNYHFYKGSPNLLTYDYEGGVMDLSNFVIESNKSEDKDFKVLIGFQMGKDKYDFYGFVESRGKGKVTISTYFGRGPCKFVFALDRPAKDFQVTFERKFVELDSPDVIYPPHWWQRPFYMFHRGHY